MKTFLIICSGNTCRSPMAEAVMNRYFEKHGLSEKYNAVSFGIAAQAGYPAHANSIKVCADHGLDIRSHRAKRLSEQDLKRASAVFTMDQSLKQYLKKNYGNFANIIFTIGEYADIIKFNRAGISRDIADPYNASFEVYEKTYRMLEEDIRNIVSVLTLKEDL